MTRTPDLIVHVYGQTAQRRRERLDGGVVVEVDNRHGQSEEKTEAVRTSDGKKEALVLIPRMESEPARGVFKKGEIKDRAQNNPSRPQICCNFFDKPPSFLKLKLKMTRSNQ